MTIQNALNGRLDSLVRTDITILGRSLSAFHLCGGFGFLLGSTLAALLATWRGLSVWLILALTVAAAFTFLALAMLTKIITGEEELTYYHHEIGITAVAALLLWLLRQPVLPYLDLIILGIGTFLIFGRLGCLLVGCCHGRPHGFGVCYRPEHANESLPPYLVGVRLFPIQGVESLLALLVVLVGTTFVLLNRPPGEVLAWYTIAYGLGRFTLEFWRGDIGRPQRAGFSEAQWTSLLLISLTVGAEAAAILPWQSWHAVILALLALLMLAVTLKRQYVDRVNYRLLHPQHVQEVAEALHQLSPRPDQTAAVPVACTSLGVQISAGRLAAANAPAALYHYALSGQNTPMTAETAEALARLILWLKHPAAANELRPGGQGVYHLLVSP